MAGLLSGILGGALQGLGEGMVKQAEQTGLEKREARLAELKHGYDKEMAGINYGNDVRLEGVKSSLRDAENAASSQRGLLNDEARERLKHTLKMEEVKASASGFKAEDVHQYRSLKDYYGEDADGFNQALASSGNPRLAALANGPRPVRPPPSVPGPPRAEMSTDDVRVWNSVVPFFTDKITGATDTKGLQQHFLDLKRPDLAAIAAGNMSGTGMSRKEAWERAREEAEKRSGPLTSNKTAYPETDGDRDAWIGRKAEELYSGGQGRAVGQATPAPVTPPPSQGGTPSSGQPPAAPPPAPQSAAPAQAGAPQGGPLRERFVRGTNGKVVSESKLRGTP